MHSWNYSLGKEATLRLPVLTSGIAFIEVTQQIVAEMSILCCHHSDLAGTGFSRPVYTVQVSHQLFDLFFNSPDGYRAAYFGLLERGWSEILSSCEQQQPRCRRANCPRIPA